MNRREQAEAHREVARNLRAQGMSLAQIGREMGVSRERARQLLAPMKPLRVMPDDAVIVALYEEGLTDSDVAQEVGVSRQHILRVRTRLGVQGRRGSPPRLVPCEVERLIEMAQGGATDEELSAAFNVSVTHAARIRCAHGLKRQTGRRKGVPARGVCKSRPSPVTRDKPAITPTDREIAQLRRCGLTCTAIGRLLGLNRNYVRGAIQRAGEQAIAPPTLADLRVLSALLAPSTRAPVKGSP